MIKMGRITMSESIKGFNPKYDDSKQEDIILKQHVKALSENKTLSRVEILYTTDLYTSEQPIQDGNAEVFTIEKDVELYTTAGGQQKIHCWLIVSKDGDKSTRSIKISRRTSKGLFGTDEITLNTKAIRNLKHFLDTLYTLNSEDATQLKKTKDTDLIELLTIDEIKLAIQNNLTKQQDLYDWISISKKREAIAQLKDYMIGNFKHETEITDFLKQNTWMLGSQYTYVASDITKINDRNILDIAPANLGSYIDIVEIKRPEETLFRYDTSHDTYYPSSNLSKAIAQTQNYIHKFETNFEPKHHIQDTQVLRPFATLIIGSKETLNSGEKDAQRILNASFNNMRVLTFQELLENAENSIATFSST